MNNNGMNFDPMTGQPLNNNGINFDPQTGQPLNSNGMPNLTQVNTPTPQVDSIVSEPTVTQPAMQQPTQVVENSIPAISSASPQNNVETLNNNQQFVNNNPVNLTNNVPTVEQNSENFISGTQAISSEKTPEKKKGINYLLVIILFLLLFAAIYFAFPILKNYI